MKKKILGLAVIAMSMISFSSMAQSQKSGNCAANADCTTACQPCPATAANCAPARCDRPDPYRGLNLTSAQKEKLTQLDASRRQSRSDKAQLRKADRQRNDSLRRADRKNYLEEVKAIVGPDQYVIYLENIVLDSPRGNGNHGKTFAKSGRDGDSKKCDKAGKHTRKGDKGVKRSEKAEKTATTRK